MKNLHHLIALSLISLIMASTPLRSQAAQQESFFPDAPNPLSPGWFFDINQLPETSPYDHRHLVVSSAGDVNGDGYEDVLVGDRDYNGTYTDSGRVWLFYGSINGLSATPGHIFNPPIPNTYGFFGGSAMSAGDVNGDGFDDIMIGADNYDGSYPDEGAVYIWYGSATGPQASYDWMAHGNATYAHFSFTIDAAGDINGDGNDDIIVGAHRYDDNNVAHAYVWYGDENGMGATGTPANADWSASDPYPGQQFGTRFGRMVRGIGDVNGDHFDDVLVGADFYDGGITNQGAVYVWYGASGGLGTAGTPANADWMAVGGQVDSRFGSTGVDGVGDLNHDGCDDLAVGAFAYDNPETSEGAIFVWYGSSGGLGASGTPANADWTAEANAYSILGYSVRAAGDVNKDGYVDLLAAAPALAVSSTGGILAGAGGWFVWYGGSDGLGVNGTLMNADLAGYGDQPSGLLGREEIGSADVNGDGLAEIFAAAVYYDHPEQDEGVAFGYYSPYKLNYLPTVKK